MTFSTQRTCTGASCSTAAPIPRLRGSRLRAAAIRLSLGSTVLAQVGAAYPISRPPRRLRRLLRRGTLLDAFGSSSDGGPRQLPLDPDDDSPFPFEEPPSSFELLPRDTGPRPTVRVRLSVHYRVHSRQMLCIGGSQIPFGWAFLSIAKVPMIWNTGDVWTVEVELPAGQRVEYKYVILEEQDWTKQENEDSEGLVEINYRTGLDSGRPPDLQVIQKQMAIVAWQPGPNRVLQVPSEAELDDLREGDVIERIAPRPGQKVPYEATHRARKPPPVRADPFEGTWEVLTVDEKSRPFLDRHDIWGWIPPSSTPSPAAGRPTIRSFFDRSS